MSVLYQSLGDKLSNTDPISNSVLISGLDFQRDGANLLIAGRYPISCLGPYIHESLHHFCFRSPVGGAIAHLYHRGFLRAFDLVMLEDSSPWDDYHVLEDIARVETILHIMRPLAEGIALFGEFDAWPGEAKSISAVMRNAAVSFAEVFPGWRTLQIGDIAKGVLNAGRSQPHTRRRKENLLMQGFTTMNGGYLPGYFFIKNLQFSLFRHIQCDLLLDSDFFLNFIVHWFYGDFNLVQAIVDESKESSPFSRRAVEDHDSVNAISVAFQKRVGKLFELKVEEIVQFDNILVSNDHVPWWKSQIGLAQDQAQATESKLLSSMNALVDYTAAGLSAHQRAMRVICHDNFARRNYLCVGSFEETVEIHESGRVSLARYERDSIFPVMSLGQSEKKGPFSGKATFDVLQSGLSEKYFFTVYADDERIVINSLADDMEQELEQLSSINLCTENCRMAKELMRTTIDAALNEESSASILRNHYREQAERGAEGMYRNWCGALMTVVGPEAEIPATPAALLGMCDGDSSYLRIIAALGCLGDPLIAKNDIAKVCAINGLTISEFKRRTERIEQNHNFRFMYPLGDYFILTI